MMLLFCTSSRPETVSEGTLSSAAPPAANSAVAPAATVSDTPVVNGVAKTSLPAFTLVAPLYVFVQANVHVPVADLMTDRVALPFWTAPLITPLPAPWSVRLRAPVAAEVTARPPAAASAPE